MSGGGDRILSVTAPTSLEILAAPITGSALVFDYLAADPRLSTFYFGHPYDARAYRRKADAVSKRLDARARERLRAALRPLTPAASGRLDRILAGDGFVVTTGQQAGLFGGPMYTVNKALSAIRLARELERLVDRPVLAVFWIAADDHDWAEVDHTFLLDRDGYAVRLDVAADPDLPPVAMADRRLGPDVSRAVDALARLLNGTAHGAPLVEAVRAAYRPDATVAGAFEALLGKLFEGLDIALVSSAHPALRQGAAPIIARALEHSASDGAAVAEATERLTAAGYTPQVPLADDASNVFFHDDSGRDRLVRDGTVWETRRSRRRIPDGELRELVREQPERFSPNVLLRPVVESALLPTLAYVAGPAELSYFAQIGCLFAAHGIEPPLVFPRFRITLVEGRVRRVLEKFELAPEDFARPLHELTAELVRREMPADAVRALEGMRTAIAEGYGRLAASAVEVDPTLDGWMKRQRNAALLNLNDAERKLAAHVRKRMRIEIGQIERAASALAPFGVPQERRLGILPFVARHGTDLLREMKAALEIQWSDVPAPGWDGVHCGE